MTLPRFYVREHEGHRSMSTGSPAVKMLVEVRVVDRDYCHRDVRIFRIPGSRATGGFTTAGHLERRRQQAAALCAELNQAEAEAMAA